MSSRDYREGRPAASYGGGGGGERGGYARSGDYSSSAGYRGENRGAPLADSRRGGGRDGPRPRSRSRSRSIDRYRGSNARSGAYDDLRAPLDSRGGREGGLRTAYTGRGPYTDGQGDSHLQRERAIVPDTGAHRPPARNDQYRTNAEPSDKFYEGDRKSGNSEPAGGASARGVVQEVEEPITDPMNADIEDEETAALRVREESRLRREAIIAKHGVATAPAVDVTVAALVKAPEHLSASAPTPQAASGTAGVVPIDVDGIIQHTILAARAPEAAVAPLAAVIVAAPGLQAPDGQGAVGVATAAPVVTAAAAAKVRSMFDDDYSGDEEEGAAAGGAGGGAAFPAWPSEGAAAAGEGAAGEALRNRNASSDAASLSLADNWDDHEGYYKIRVGEVLDGRYLVLGARGRGVFSSVLYCRDTKAAADAAAAAAAAAEQQAAEDEATAAAAAAGTVTTAAAPVAVSASGAVVPRHAALATGSSAFVAVKVIRANDTMRRAGAKELDLLQALATADGAGRYHCVRLLATFEHRGHLCLVFEPLHMNLKEVQNKFGKGVGISIAAVRSYAKQMLLSLSLLAKLHIVHADIKPHNILANERYNIVKLADFGSAFREDGPDNVPTPLLVSRFYRAPEIILGYQHSIALDMWSVACCLYELYTGSPLFPGADNNDMLWLHQCTKGRFPNRMVRHHLRQADALGFEAHFEPERAAAGGSLRFRRAMTDPVTRAPTERLVDVPAAATDGLLGRLMAKRAADDDRRAVGALRDLLEAMLTLDPARRISVKDAIAHPFLTGSAKPGGGGDKSRV